MNISLTYPQIRNLEGLLWQPGCWDNELVNKIWLLARDSNPGAPAILDITISEYNECLEKLNALPQDTFDPAIWAPVISDLITAMKEHALLFAVDDAINADSSSD